jgi:hypothetical protein
VSNQGFWWCLSLQLPPIGLLPKVDFVATPMHCCSRLTNPSAPRCLIDSTIHRFPRFTIKASWYSLVFYLSYLNLGKILLQPYIVAQRSYNWCSTIGAMACGQNLCRNLTLRECEDETHTPEMGTWKSSRTLESSEFDCKGQNTLHWEVFYIIGNLSKFRCRKWARLSHLDIYSTSYGQKKGRESNWQFDSRPLKVKNRPDPDACRWSGTHRWTALNESYNFALDLVQIWGLSKKL